MGTTVATAELEAVPRPDTQKVSTNWLTSMTAMAKRNAQAMLRMALLGSPSSISRSFSLLIRSVLRRIRGHPRGTCIPPGCP